MMSSLYNHSMSSALNKVRVKQVRASLRAVEYDDIQLLRYWRNLGHVQDRMVLKSDIDRDEQRRWFESLSLGAVHYCIFSLDSKDIGCVYLTRIDHSKKTCEGGIFCGDTDFLKHWVNIWACIKIYNYAFFELDLVTSFATILRENQPALNLNRSLGYESLEDSDENIGRFVLTRDSFVKSSEKIQRFLREFVKQSL